MPLVGGWRKGFFQMGNMEHAAASLVLDFMSPRLLGRGIEEKQCAFVWQPVKAAAILKVGKGNPGEKCEFVSVPLRLGDAFGQRRRSAKVPLRRSFSC